MEALFRPPPRMLLKSLSKSVRPVGELLPLFVGAFEPPVWEDFPPRRLPALNQIAHIAASLERVHNAAHCAGAENKQFPLIGRRFANCAFNQKEVG